MRPLVVFTVFFGEMPPWLPLTLRSMELNHNVSFVVIGDAPAPAALPPNVAFETIPWAKMQTRLSMLLTPENASSVRYGHPYKANDIKPLAPTLYPHLAAGYEWWAWADLDVIFGDLLKFMRRAAERPACCKVPLRPDGQPRSMRAVNVYLHKAACPCPAGTRVNVICPLYPNPWRKKAWGPFTAFRQGALTPYVAAASGEISLRGGAIGGSLLASDGGRLAGVGAVHGRRAHGRRLGVQAGAALTRPVRALDDAMPLLPSSGPSVSHRHATTPLQQLTPRPPTSAERRRDPHIQNLDSLSPLTWTPPHPPQR